MSLVRGRGGGEMIVVQEDFGVVNVRKKMQRFENFIGGSSS